MITFDKITFSDYRGWRISFAGPSPRWTYAVHFQDMLVQPATPANIGHFTFLSRLTDGEFAAELLARAEKSFRAELPEMIVTCGFEPRDAEHVSVSFGGLGFTLIVPISVAEEVIGECGEITIDAALKLVRNLPRIPRVYAEWCAQNENKSSLVHSGYLARIAKMQETE